MPFMSLNPIPLGFTFILNISVLNMANKEHILTVTVEMVKYVESRLSAKLYVLMVTQHCQSWTNGTLGCQEERESWCRWLTFPD